MGCHFRRVGLRRTVEEVNRSDEIGFSIAILFFNSKHGLGHEPSIFNDDYVQFGQRQCVVGVRHY